VAAGTTYADVECSTILLTSRHSGTKKSAVE
jgi:hypothetical protein